MTKKILCCDCDGVVINTNKMWFDELKMITKKDIKYEDVCHNYDLTKAFQPELADRGYTGFEWWKQKNLYCGASPLEGAVETLQWASQYVDIFFVSAIMGTHGSSKYDFIMEHFPFTKAVVFTKEKGCVKHDYAIDDRVENINRFDRDAKKILFQNESYQTTVLESDENTWVAFDWTGIREVIGDWLC